MEKYLRFQTSVFGDFKGIDLSEEPLGNLYNIFLKYGMMPTIMKEYDLASQNIKNRPNFISNDNSISISFASNRIDIVNDVSTTDKVYEKKTFVELSIKYLKEVFALFNLGIYRMSYVEDEIIKILDNPKDSSIRDEYINSEHLYNKQNIFGWSANSVSLEKWNINGKVEEVNINLTTSLRKINALKEGQVILLNALALTQDLNTIAGNTLPRLNCKDLESFLKEATQKSDTIRLIIEGRE